MSDLAFQKAYEEQNRRDYITNATIATAIQIPLNLSCSVMDHFMYPDLWWLFFKARICSVLVAAGAWFWFKIPYGRAHHQYGVLWIMSPLLMILWMIYAAGDLSSPYYAGLNIILLGMGLLTPWAYMQNLLVTIFVLVMYVWIASSMKPPQPMSSLINNVTFLALTAVIVVAASLANSRTRFREFALRWELDKSRRAIEESNRKLIELDQIKSRFFANISHELRTPLTLLLAPLETLLQRFSGSFDRSTRDLLVTMHSNGMRLLKLINDLLDLVRLESGRMEAKREPVEVAEFVKGLASAARQVADDKRLRLEMHVDPRVGTVLADRDKLEKILLNLLFNALKFTPAGGRVEVRAERRDAAPVSTLSPHGDGSVHAEAASGTARSTAGSGQELVLTVADTGMGISDKHLPFVFDRFWQADGSSKRKYQGVGIGLALVKELTEIQGGKVEVQSQEGKGTTFTVRFPYQRAESRIKGPVPAEAGAAPNAVGTVTSEEWLANLYRRAELFPAMTPLQDSLKPVEIARNGHLPKVLVADDEPDMLRFLKTQLGQHYEVLEAVDGQQAVEKASQFLPDIILLDMMMPEKDGLQACREIREHTPTQSIPIILLTARADEETKLTALGAGASDFLAKPFSTTELHVRIKNLVESHQYQRKLAKQNLALESTIDQLKETEMQLVQNEKLASLGRMSAGIIHEINNPLNFATTGLFTLRKKGKDLAPEDQAEYAEVLKDVEEGIKRVKTIVSDLRMFTHPDAESRDQVEVAEVVASSLRFLSNEWKNRVQVHRHFAEHQTICANKNKLIHVVTNLLQNALDALHQKTFQAEQPTIWIDGRVQNGRSVLSIRDNGPGIAADHINKIFDPFFTTKEVGKGMGLGLSICYRIVHEYEGQISVKSEPGKYCEFALEFPAKG